MTVFAASAPFQQDASLRPASRAILAMGLLLACVAALSSCKPDTTQARDDSPAGVVTQFYNWRIQSHMTGVPDAGQIEDMRPWISSELQALLLDSSRQADKQAAAQSGKKPKQPVFTDGDLFSSISQGPTSFRTGMTEALANDAHVVPVRFASGRQLPAINWTDRVKVINENGHYVVADVEYANHWQAGGGSLLNSLKRSTGF